MDTSVLTAYYCPEPGSENAQKLLVNQPGLAVSWLTEVELISAISRKVRERGLTRRDAGRIVALYREHVNGGSYRLSRLESVDFKWAAGTIGQFDNKLRTLDALHLAVVVRESLNLATADRVLADAAKEFGVKATLLR